MEQFSRQHQRLGYVAGRSAAYEYQALFCVFFNLLMEWNGMEWNRIIFIMLLSMLMVDFMHLSAAIPWGWSPGTPGHFHNDVYKSPLPKTKIG